MGKLEWEAKDEMVGILRRKIGRLRQHSGLLVFSIVLSGVLAAI
jgi:hypothetical protein